MGFDGAEANSNWRASYGEVAPAFDEDGGNWSQDTDGEIYSQEQPAPQQHKESLSQQLADLKDYDLWKEHHPVGTIFHLSEVPGSNPSALSAVEAAYGPDAYHPAGLMPAKSISLDMKPAQQPPEVQQTQSKANPVQPNHITQRQRQLLDQRFWTNELAAATSAGLAGWIPKALSAAAKEQLGRAIEAEDPAAAASNPFVKASKWWESRFGLSDDGKLFDRAGRRFAELDGEIADYKRQAESEVNEKLARSRQATSDAARAWIEKALSPVDRAQLAGFCRLTGKNTCLRTLELIGMVPADLDELLKNPAFAQSCRDNGPHLVQKLAQAVTSQEFKQFLNYREMGKAAPEEMAVPPEMERYVSSTKASIFDLLGVGEAGRIKPSFADLEPHDMGAILRNSLETVEHTPAGFWQNFGRGMMFAGGVQASEDLIERGLSLGANGHGNHLSSYASAIGIPLALSMRANPIAKFGTALGIGVLGACADGMLPSAKNISYGALLTPSATEEAIVGIAAGLPLRAPGVLPRVCAIGGAMVAAKVITSLTGGSRFEDEKTQAQEARSADLRDRTAASLNSEIDKYKSLGALVKNGELPGADGIAARTPANASLSWYRSSAAQLTAAGERKLDDGYYLGKGALGLGEGKSAEPAWSMLIPDRDKTRSASFILQNTDLDLGGRALGDFSIARQNIDAAEKQTASLLNSANPTWHGTQVKASEIQELNKVKARIDQRINVIYGKHDIPELYSSLKGYFDGPGGSNEISIRHRILERLQTANSDKKFAAKLYRDLALVDLAFAGHALGRGEVDAAKIVCYGNGEVRRQQGFDGVQDELRQAQHLDNSNPDNVQLDAILSDLQSQLSNRTSNPCLNVLGV